MKTKGKDKVKIPRFSNDQEAFAWYESQEVTDHLEDTEEINLDTIIYQDSKGLWYRASNGVQVPAPAKAGHGLRKALISEQIRIIYGKGDVTWTSTSLLSAIMQK